MKTPENQYIPHYTGHLKSSNLAKGYKALMEYLHSLRTHFKKQYPTQLKIGSFYQGYMDMSYFPIIPQALNNHPLKFGLVFNHEKIRFEIWLVGQNKQVQKKYWSWFSENEQALYPLSKNPQDSIIVHLLVEQPDFSQLDTLTDEIASKTLEFIQDITAILNKSTAPAS